MKGRETEREGTGNINIEVRTFFGGVVIERGGARQKEGRMDW